MIQLSTTIISSKHLGRCFAPLLKKTAFLLTTTVICSLIGLTSCNNEQPFVTVSHLSSAVLEVGDSLLLHIDRGDANSIRDITYTPVSQGTICTVVPTGKKDMDATVYALSPGFDTITIEYVYTRSIFDYGTWSTIAIEVKEKQSNWEN